MNTSNGRTLSIAVACALAAISLFPTAGAATQADNGLASITLYHALCPPGYAGATFFEDCYQTPGADTTFFLERRDRAQPDIILGEWRATTGDSGLLAFENIDEPGDYLLRPADDPDRYHLGCVDETGERVVPSGPSYGGFWLDLALVDDLRCDWYSVSPSRPGDASLAYRVLTCPLNYSGEAHAADCLRPFVGWTYYLNDLSAGSPTADSYELTGRMEASDSDGWAIFDGLAAGRYGVISNIPGHDLIDWREVCTGARSNETEPPLTLGAGDRVECTAYATFTEFSGGAFGDLTIDYGQEGAPFVVTAETTGETAQVTTNRQGVSRFHLRPDTYTVRGGGDQGGPDPTVSCTNAGAQDTIVTTNEDGFAIIVEVAASNDIRCVWTESAG